MKLVFHACNLLALANVLFASHLPCQRLPSTIPLTTRSPTSLPNQPAPTSFIRGHPDACCGSLPYDSTIKMCCFGSVIDMKQKKCCLGGSPVPISANCDCYPKSTWIYEQIVVVKSLEIKFGTLVELLDTSKQRLQPIVMQRQTLVEELDAKVEELFNSFLEKINLTRNENPEEIQSIINLILFRNAMEEDDVSTGETYQTANPVIKSATEEVNSQEEVDESIDFKAIANNLMKKQSFINYLLEVHNKKVILPSTLAERDRQEIEMLVMQRVEAIPVSTYAEIDKIVVRRSVILLNLNRRNANLEILRRRLSAIERLLAIAMVDHELMLSTLLFLETSWDEAISLESIAKEEDQEIQDYFEAYREEYGLPSTQRPRNEEEEESIVATKRLFLPNIDPKDIGAEPLHDNGEELTLNQIEYIQENEIFDIVTTEVSEKETEYPEIETNTEFPEFGFPETEFSEDEEQNGPGCDVRILEQFIKDVSYRSDLLTVDMSFILNSNKTVNTIEELTEKYLEQFQTTKTELAFSKLTKPPNDFVPEQEFERQFDMLLQLVNRIEQTIS